MAAALASVGPPVALPAEGRPTTTAPSIQIRVVEQGGFHWQDAAVGSLAAFGFALVAAGIVVATRRNHAEPSQAKPHRNH